MTKILLHPTAYRVATDAQLVELVRGGDDRAFAAIHDRYEARLVAFARQLLGGAHHDAEEVVQDAFVRALHALRADDREMALKAWLFTIVRNRELDVPRRPVRTTDIDPPAAVLRHGPGGPPPCGATAAATGTSASRGRRSSTRWSPGSSGCPSASGRRS